MLLIDETGLKSGFLGSHNEILKIKSLLNIPNNIEILGFVTAGVEDSTKNIKKEKIKKIVHKEIYENKEITSLNNPELKFNFTAEK